ncbi:MAG: potassium channel family protein [Nitrososphaerales archaeon]
MLSASKTRRSKQRRFNVKEVLGETRDTLQLMLDLAYSTILFEEDHFGQEVMELEERMSELIFTARSAVMLGAKGTDEIAALTGVLKIATAAEKIGDSASDIAEVPLVGIGLPKRFIKTLHLMEDTLAGVTISEGSEVIGSSVADIESKTGMTLVALRSGGKWSINPANSELLKEGDRLIVNGSFESLEEFQNVTTDDDAAAIPDVRELEEPAMHRQIRKTIVEMKNLSELSIDLAYSSILFSSRDIAKEVSNIEAKLDELRTNLEHLVLSYAKEVQEVDQLRGLLRLASASEMISDASNEIAEVVLSEIGLHPILQYAISEAEEVITKVEISKGSALEGKSFSESFAEQETGMQVIALKKKTEEKWIYHPKGDLVFEIGDVMIAKGRKEGERMLYQLAAAAG